MIRAYKKKPITLQNIDYEKLFILTVKDKYFSLVLGLVTAFIISTLIYNLIIKSTSFNLVFKVPTINFNKKVIKAVTKKAPEKIYAVQEGDDLWKIAEKFYGSGFNAFDISVANKISDSASVDIGKKLIIPSVKPRKPTVGEISAVSTSQVTLVENKYVVEPGDSLSLIAQKAYGDMFTYDRILKANNLTLADSIHPGMVLIIPR